VLLLRNDAIALTFHRLIQQLLLEYQQLELLLRCQAGRELTRSAKLELLTSRNLILVQIVMTMMNPNQQLNVREVLQNLQLVRHIL
jgi:hypothetical protein